MSDIITIQNQIFTFREVQVMVDRDLATMYQVETKVLNQAVKRNGNRFPSSFRFQLTDIEKNELVTNCDRFNNLKHSSVNPYVFTGQMAEKEALNKEIKQQLSKIGFQL